MVVAIHETIVKLYGCHFYGIHTLYCYLQIKKPLTLQGCANVEFAGTTYFSVPVSTRHGKMVCLMMGSDCHHAEKSK